VRTEGTTDGEKINDEGAKVNASVISLWRQEDDRHQAELGE